MAETCQKVLDGFGMPAKWVLNIMVPIYKGKGDIGNCSCNRAVKFPEYVINVLERRLRRIVSVDEMQFGFIPEKGTIDDVFI